MNSVLSLALLDCPEGVEFIKRRWEQINNSCSSVAVNPASFSKAQTVEKICECIKAYPEQLCNTQEAHLYTLEFTERDMPHGPVGTANEINEICGMDTLLIWTQYEGFVWLEYQDGKWVVTETQPDKIPQ